MIKIGYEPPQMVAIKSLGPQCKPLVELGMKGINMVYLQRTKALLVLFQIIMERSQNSFDLLAFAVRCVMNFLAILKILIINLRQVVLNARDRFGDSFLSIKIPAEPPDGMGMASFMAIDEPVQRTQGKDFVSSISFSTGKCDKLPQCFAVVCTRLAVVTAFNHPLKIIRHGLFQKFSGRFNLFFCSHIQASPYADKGI